MMREIVCLEKPFQGSLAGADLGVELPPGEVLGGFWALTCQISLDFG